MEFLADILAGICIAFGYGFSSTFRRRSHRVFFRISFDIIFWIFTSILTLIVLYYTSDMELRAYEFLGILTGVFCYFNFFARLAQPLQEKTADVFQFFLKITFTILRFSAIMIKNGVLCFIWPFRKLGKLLIWLTKKPLRAMRETTKIIKRI